VASRARRATPRPWRAVGLVRAQPLRVGRDHHPGMQDVHQPAADNDLDRLPGIGGPSYGCVPLTISQFDGLFNQSLARILRQAMELDLGTTTELNPVTHRS